MPTRILLRLFFLAGLLAPWCAFALGVGQLEVRSALNQTFEAELPLITSNPAELTGLVARIPRQEEFDRAGVERLELLSKLRFSVQAPPGGRSVVRVTSLEPVREPNFNLLMELVWPRGRMIREFAIQLDPELYANRRPPPPPPPVVVPPPPVAVAAPPPKAAAAAPVAPQLPPAPPVSFEGASFYGPVKSGETLAGIANRVRPSTAISIPQMMAILVAGNSAAFVSGNPNTLRSGATLKVPTPQALGAPAAAPATLGPAIARAPVDLTQPSPPLAPMPESASPPVAAEPGTLQPPPIPATSLPATPVAEVAPPAAPVSPVPLSTGQPQEIVPRATIPQPEAPPPAAQLQPAVVAAPPAAQPQPEVAAAPPAALPPATARPAEAEAGWMSDPVVWIAIALITLAIAALILLPLLRRPARPKLSVVEAVMPGLPEGEPRAVGEPQSVPTTQTQLREPRSARPQPPPAAAPDRRVEPAPGLAGAPVPRPIGELLKEFDFDLGEKASPAAAVRQGAAPAGEIKAPLLEAEPPTASVTRREVSPFAETPTDRAEQEGKKPKEEKESPALSQAELPSDLRLDGLGFDFGDLGLDKIVRPQLSELPPLEMKLETAGRKPSVLPPVELGIAEPATEPPSLAPVVAVPGGAAMPDLKFEFADVTQEMARHGAQEESLKLDEALQDLGGDTLKIAGQEEKIGGVSVTGMDNADYVETKLDLASAYLDMGDQVGARSLLEEVLQEGNVQQRERAGEFLKKLS